MRYTKDALIQELIEHNKEVTMYMSNMTNALVDLNDTNKLHAGAINKNTEAVEKMVNINNSFLKFFRWIVVLVVVALVVLAGAEKALDFVPVFGG